MSQECLRELKKLSGCRIGRMDTYSWYSTLIKPDWAPPAWVFGPVWTLLYAIIAVSFGTVFYKAITRQIPRLVALPFALNLIFNFAFTPLQFGLQNNLLATVDILLVLGTLIWVLTAVWHRAPRLRWVVCVIAPFFLLLSFPTLLLLSFIYF